MERGDGCYLYDVDGRRYIDFTNHHTAQILGHNHTVVNSAIKAQVSRGIALGAPTGIEVELAEEMCRRVPSLDCIRFCNSGTEATLHAIRLARAFTGRPKIAKFEGAYHGSHDAVEISKSVFHRRWRRQAPSLHLQQSPPLPVSPLMRLTKSLSFRTTMKPLLNASSLTIEMSWLVSFLTQNLMLFLSEQDSFNSLRRFCERTILSSYFEIVSFRLAPGGFQELCGITPDLTTYGKIIGGGFPVGGLGGRAEVMELLDSTGRGRGGLFQSGTFSAHPVVMAAGLATLQQLTADAYAHLDCLGERLRDEFENLFARKQISAQVVGMGSLFSIHFLDGEIRNYRDLARKNSAMAYNIFLSLLDKEFFLNSSLDFNALSLPMQERQVDELVGAVECAVEQFA